jgi:hypothetical protein
MLKQPEPDEPIRVDENTLHLDFKPDFSNPHFISVIGFGSNVYGSFDLRGFLHIDNWQLQLQKVYRTEAKKSSLANCKGVITNPDLQEDLDNPGVIRSEKILREWRRLQDFTSAGPRDTSKSQVQVVTPRSSRAARAQKKRAGSSAKSRRTASHSETSQARAVPAAVATSASKVPNFNGDKPPESSVRDDQRFHKQRQQAEHWPSRTEDSDDEDRIDDDADDDVAAQLASVNSWKHEGVEEPMEVQGVDSQQDEWEEQGGAEEEEAEEEVEEEVEEEEEEEEDDLTPEERAAKKQKVSRVLAKLADTLGAGARYYSYSRERRRVPGGNLAFYTGRAENGGGASKSSNTKMKRKQKLAKN